MKSTLIPGESTGPGENESVTVTIRPGVGHLDGSIFARELSEMYRRYAGLQGWAVELISYIPDSGTGIKEAVLRVSGQGVYEHLKYETGRHRVQRIPADERQGRAHTSVAIVSVQPVILSQSRITPAESSQEVIRTYSFLSDQVTDHRIRFAIADVRNMLNGNLERVMN